MTKKIRRKIRDVRLGKIPPFRDALAKILGTKTLHLDQVVTKLAKRGWSPASKNPRKYVAETLSREPMFEHLGGSRYRVKGAKPTPVKKAVTKKPVKRVAKSPKSDLDTMRFEFDVPPAFTKGLRALAHIENKPERDIIAEVMVVAARALGHRINSTFETLKVPTLDPESPEAEFVRNYEANQTAARSAKTRAGLAKARARGATIGRPRKKFDVKKAQAMKAEGKSVRRISKELKVPVSTMTRALKSVKDATAITRSEGPPAKRGRGMAWEPKHVKILMDLIAAAKPVKSGSRTMVGWSSIGKEFSARIGHKVSGQACFTKWQRLQAQAKAQGRKNGIIIKPKVPIGAVLRSAGLETTAEA